MKIAREPLNCKRKIPMCAMPRHALTSLYPANLPLNPCIFVFDSKLAIQSPISDEIFCVMWGYWPLRSQTKVNFLIVDEIYENNGFSDSVRYLFKCYVLKVVQVGTTLNFAILRLRYVSVHKCWLFYKWVLQRQCIKGCTSGCNQQFCGFTSGYYCILNIGCFTSGYYSVNLLSGSFRN